MILTGQRGMELRMNGHMTKRRSGREIWRFNRTLHRRKDRSTLITWVRSLQVDSTRKSESVRPEILLDGISNLKTTMISFMISCRSRK